VPVYHVIVGDKTYSVEVPDPNADPLQIVVDGESFLVDIARRRGAPGEGSAVPDSRNAPVPGLLAAGPAPARRSQRPRPGSQSIVAPMPGTVLSILVQAGQNVAPGDVLCVLEAMKMKNPIPANQVGQVAEIAVKPGQAVAFGDLLIRLA